MMIGHVARCLRMAQVPETRILVLVQVHTADTHSKTKINSLQSCRGFVWPVNPPCPFGSNPGPLVSGHAHTVLVFE